MSAGSLWAETCSSGRDDTLCGGAAAASVEGARCLRSDRCGGGVAPGGIVLGHTHSQGGWIWQLRSIVHHLTESVPRTRRDDPVIVTMVIVEILCSLYTQG